MNYQMKKSKKQTPQFTPSELDDGSKLNFSWSSPSGNCQWTYRLSGESFGKPWAVHMKKTAAKKLALMILEAL